MKSIEPYLLMAPVVFYSIGSLAALMDRKAPGRAAHFVSLIGGLVGTYIALLFLLNDTTQQLTFYSIAPFATFNFRLDPLSAYFLLVLSLVAIAVSIYAIGYLDAEHAPVAGLGFAFNGFLNSMVLVLLANNAFTFLFAWESMSLISFFLVIHDHRQEEVRSAGFIYLAMTHVSTAFLLVGFFVLAVVGGGQDFDVLRASATSMPNLSRDLVFLLALVAFGTKAGMIPLHIWLPRAHPAAPSHVSALMSGVMIKVAIYGLMRIGWELAGPGPAWWGGLLLVLGATSAVLGVLYALMEHDLKRLLAYHSVENIGIILIGLGAAFLFTSFGQPAAAALALLACLLHVLNHAVFKSLLFLGAGAVQRATHTRDIEMLGGLIHRMPWTAATFLVGAVAISALPPLNGFVSEWLTFQSLLALGVSAPGPLVAIGAAIVAGLLALTGGLAAFCFVKAFGVVFLGMPRSAPAGDAEEVSRPMLFGMALLALLCFVIGLLPTAFIRLLAPVTDMLAGSIVTPSMGLFPNTVVAREGSLAPLAVLGILITFGAFAMLLGRLIGGPGRSRIAPPWSCGIALESSMQYSAAALAKPARIIFRGLVRPYREIEREHPGGIAYFVSAVRYEAGIHPVYERYIYRPVVATLLGVANRVRTLQTGSLRTYLAYIFATLVVVLLLTR